MGLYGKTIKVLTSTETSDGMGGVTIADVATPIPCRITPLTVSTSKEIFGLDIDNGYSLRSNTFFEIGQRFEVNGEVCKVIKAVRGRRKTLYVLEGE